MANTQINIGANGKTTLATAGKYCDRNIDVNVNVPASGITPSGTKTITSNGSHDVTNYAIAQVNVPVGVTPSGTIEITANGTYDVTNKASAVVNVPAPASNRVVRTLTIGSDLGGTAAWNDYIVSGDPFIAEHYADPGFSATLIPAAGVAAATGNVYFIHHGNLALAPGKAYGVAARWNSASAVTSQPQTAAISGTCYTVGFRARSTGNLGLYLPANQYLRAGTYYLVLAVN